MLINEAFMSARSSTMAMCRKSFDVGLACVKSTASVMRMAYRVFCELLKKRFGNPLDRCSHCPVHCASTLSSEIEEIPPRTRIQAVIRFVGMAVVCLTIILLSMILLALYCLPVILFLSHLLSKHSAFFIDNVVNKPT